MSKQIVLATSNRGKLAELSQLLADKNLLITPQSELNVTDIEETGLTFVENALLKARHAAACTGLPAIADDSGLVVPTLAGAPGLYSARYAGHKATDQQNIAKLLADLQDIPTEQRQAYFCCTLVFLRHAYDPAPIIGNGYWYGEIIQQPIGHHGFGYDPIFYLANLACTAAQLTSQQKSQWSHRAQALTQLVTALRYDNFTQA